MRLTDAEIERGLQAAEEHANSRRFPYKGYRWWKLIVTWCRNGAGAPLVDDAFVNDREGNRYAAKAVSLVRRRNEHGERVPGPAFVIGWRR